MSKINNYPAFYVSEPFNESTLGAHAAKDFCYYNMLKAWKGSDNSFPFNNAHNTTYNVRDNTKGLKQFSALVGTKFKTGILLYSGNQTSGGFGGKNLQAVPISSIW